jgi:nitroreductase
VIRLAKTDSTFKFTKVWVYVRFLNMGIFENHEMTVRQLQWRYSPKKFDASKKLTPEQWQTLENALILSPSSYGLQPWKFVVVTDQNLKEKLKSVSWNQPQVVDCSHYVVMAVKEKMDEAWVQKYLDRMAHIRGVGVETLQRLKDAIIGDVVHGARSKNAKEWAARQVYIALGQLIASAAFIGVDSCPMEGFQAEKYDEILGLPEQGFRTVVCCAIGYRHLEDPIGKLKKVRFESKDVIDHR